jgi:hypothetical protein
MDNSRATSELDDVLVHYGNISTSKLATLYITTSCANYLWGTLPVEKPENIPYGQKRSPVNGVDIRALSGPGSGNSCPPDKSC